MMLGFYLIIEPQGSDVNVSSWQFGHVWNDIITDQMLKSIIGVGG